MRKLMVLACLTLACSVFLHGVGDLLSAYRKGTIKIVPDPDFGAGIAWDSMFDMNGDNALAILPDGSFFLGAQKEGKIYKFDATGRLLKSFGRKGQGPGDLQGIRTLGILDGKTLVVNEGNRRLSLFNLEGMYLRAVKVDGLIWTMAALRGGHVGIVVEAPGESDPKAFRSRYRVLLEDVDAGTEREIAAFTSEVPRGEFVVRITAFDHYPRLATAGPDTLIVALPASPEILLFSADGVKKGSFKLDIEPTRFTWDHFAYITEMDKDEQARKIFTMNKSKIALPEFLPYYLAVAVDPEGHLLVYENHFARLSRDVSFRVYALDGKFLAAVKLDPGEFEATRPLGFWRDRAFAWLTRKDAEGSFVFGGFKFGE